MLKRLRFILLGSFLASTGLASALSLPSVFSDHMVLQRSQPVPVWGEAGPGSVVTVEFAGQKKTVTAGSDGKWRVDLDPMPASSTPRPFHVSSSGSQVSFSDVLVGEVWLCSGQSNMAWRMEDTTHAAAAIAAADFPQIRLYDTPRLSLQKPGDQIDSRWMICTPENVRLFSGTAYYFGRKLHQDLNIPVGLLLSAWGATHILPWVPPCGFDGIDSLADAYRQTQNMPKLFDAGNKRLIPNTKYREISSAIYNGMIAAHVPFAIRGVIWYQGEADRRDGLLYLDKTRALLQGWRKLWGYDFPFYFVQIAPYQYGSDDPFILPEFWEAQSAIVKTIQKTGMAVISDAATLDSIHPPNKEVPGTRLALLAEAGTYGMKVVSTGPVFQTLEKSGGSLKVVFSSAEGLTTRDGKAPDWFEIAGVDGVFKLANTEISGDSVILSSPDVPAPSAVRFAWNKLAVPNLINGAGLPASAFRAGK